jgi:outer membrane lipoprotein-sorting protein
MLRFILLLLLPTWVFANTDIRTKYQKEIRAVESYLDSFYSLSASFKQSNKFGEISYGKIFIAKPEKIRCEYNSPNQSLLIMNGEKVTYYDKELDEISRASTDVNALKLISIQGMKFSNYKIKSIEKEPNFISFTIVDFSKELKQELLISLRFSYPKVELKELVVTSDDNQINMIFDKCSYNNNLSKELFHFNRIKNNKFR